MGTRSTITAQVSDGTYKSIYCQYDGYIDGVGKTLVDHYTTLEKIEALLNLGYISVLGEECTCPEGHTYEDPVEGYTIAYQRDRGEDEDDNKTGLGKTAQQAINNGPGEQQYNYSWISGEWICRGQTVRSLLEEQE